MAADSPDGPAPTMMRSRTDILSSYLSENCQQKELG
jgi:hypothetical protein